MSAYARPPKFAKKCTEQGKFAAPFDAQMLKTFQLQGVLPPLTHRPGALSDPGARAPMCPLHTLGAPPAAATWRGRCITLLRAYDEGSCMV